MEHAQAVVDALQRFEFTYPFVMACVWVAGALFYWWFEERGGPRPDQPPAMAAWPRAAVIVPCHDEAPHVVETVRALTRLRYPDYEVIAVNDGSTDATGRLLDALAAEEPRLRVVHLPANRGRRRRSAPASALTDAAYVICVDGDALLDEHALAWLVRALASDPAWAGSPATRACGRARRPWAASRSGSSRR